MLQVNRRWFSGRHWWSQRFSISAGGCITSAATAAPSPRRLSAVQNCLHGAFVLPSYTNLHIFTRYVYIMIYFYIVSVLRRPFALGNYNPSIGSSRTHPPMLLPAITFFFCFVLFSAINEILYGIKCDFNAIYCVYYFSLRKNLIRFLRIGAAGIF